MYLLLTKHIFLKYLGINFPLLFLRNIIPGNELNNLQTNISKEKKNIGNQLQENKFHIT
jgi:hypothetical protein